MRTNSTITWPLSELLKDWTTLQAGYSTTLISGLSLDSHSVNQGDLFFALQGLQHHGLTYSQQAIENGAVALCWESSSHVNKENLPVEIPCVEIQNLQHKVGLICQRFYHKTSSHMYVIGVTGTDGKTSVSQFIAQALQNLNVSCGVIGTLGYGVYPNFANASHTTPDAIRIHSLLHDFYKDGVKHAVIEASSHGLKQGRLNGIEMNTAVFTNLGRDHMDYHESHDDYANSKQLLFQITGLENAVINADDNFGSELANNLTTRLNIVVYSIKPNFESKNNYIKAYNIKSSAGKTNFDIDSSWGKAAIETKLFGRFNVGNLLAVLGVLLAERVSFNDAVRAISTVSPVHGRIEFITGNKNSPTVVIDYAHTPQALINVLKVLREQCTGKLWCVFGCGGNRDQGKRKLMAQAVEKYADKAVLTDDNPRFENPAAITDEVQKGFSVSSNHCLIHDRREAIHHAIRHADVQDMVLIAGKGHETVQIIKDKYLPFDDKKIASEILQRI